MQFSLFRIRVTIVRSYLVIPEGVSFNKPQTFSCAGQMDPDNALLFTSNGSTKFHANMPHNPAEEFIPVMVPTWTLLDITTEETMSKNLWGQHIPLAQT